MSARTAAAAYFAGSVILTWPLALGLSSDVPGDLGDSLLNMWILAWGAEHAPRLLTGSLSWQAFWNANIFHPEPLALGFSEHLFGQALQILPVYWLTGNVILAYNLVFLSTFALSGLGTFLLVRDLTGNARAAFIAGLVYGFLPYRIASIPHVQVLSAQWMPFALFGLNRFVTRLGTTDSDRPPSGDFRSLAGGTAALVMQNWSCGYYLLYFAPFVPAFVVHRMWSVGTLRDRRSWAWLVCAATVTSLLTIPFLLPYAATQALFGFERPLAEVVRFSASAWSYLTASEQLRLWGGLLRFDTRPESETFLGFVPWLLAMIALAALLRGPRLDPDGTAPRQQWLRVLTALLGVAVIAHFVALASIVLFGGFEFRAFGLSVSARAPLRLLVRLVAATALLFVISPGARTIAARLVRTPVVFFAGATMVAVWLSLGPLPASGGASGSGVGLYGLLFDYVPGFDGVRVPARYAMIAGLFLALIAGYGMAEVLRRMPGSVRAALVTTVTALLVLAEGAAIPIATNGVWAQNEATPPARVFPAALAPPVYARIAQLPEESVITEFPFGDAAWEIRYVYYSHVHWRRLTNGYSGAFPPAYQARVARWRRVEADPAAAWRALVDSGTSHVVLHPAAFANPADADHVDHWLRANQATEVARFPDGDRLFQVRD